MRIATQQIGPYGAEWAVWDYDITRPRMPEAEDPRMRFAATGLIGVYKSVADAEIALLTNGEAGSGAGVAGPPDH